MAYWKRFTSKATGKPVLLNLDLADLIRPDLDDAGTLIYMGNEEPVHVTASFEIVAAQVSDTPRG